MMLTVLLLASLTVTSTMAARIANARRPLDQGVPSWAKASTFVRDAPLEHPIHLSIHMQWRHRLHLENFAQSVSDPKSSIFGNFLEPPVFFKKYSPLEADVEQMEEWLTASGFTILEKAKSRKFLVVEGTVGQAAKAFNTRFGLYKVNEHTLRAPKITPSAPASFGRIMVLGLDQRDATYKPMVRVRPWTRPGNLTDEEQLATSNAKTRSPTLCHWVPSTSSGGYATPPYCGYDQSQIRAIYGAPSTATGKGVTVAIIDAYASPFMQNDLILWSKERGIKAGQITQLYPSYAYTLAEVLLNPSPGYVPSWQVEESLDIETVHSIAPGAKIIYMGAASAKFTDLNSALAYVVDNKLATLVSNSYGVGLFTPAEFDAADQRDAHQATTDILMEAATLGVGVYASSGDDGDRSLIVDYFGNKVSVTDYPASDTWITAVGGTTLGISSTKTRLFETYWANWNTTSEAGILGNFLGGGGGGISSVYPLPAYQKSNKQVSTFFAKYGGGKSGRVVPDISAFADPITGYSIGLSSIASTTVGPYDYIYGPLFKPGYQFGGTSLACPTIVALIACAQEIRKSKKPFGFINKILYSLPATAYFDVTAPTSPLYVDDYYEGTILFAKTQAGIKQAAGFDSATGLGVPTANFFKQLAVL
eukprot:TRINITY_DN6_c0_g1_i3.p1 TRINITY_DN6_c0_g1~~TRINITY_DN6_c0_g1_i3.p1  ORF type:complete len:648 (-),score=49.38 TRINITY_DN6_c0_g1_i3:449-2392(-)